MNQKEFMENKGLRILLLIIGVVMAVVGIVVMIMGRWMGLIAILAAGAMLGISTHIGPRTVNEHYNPMVEKSGRDMGAKMTHHPEDVPLNPWDTIAGDGEQSGK